MKYTKILSAAVCLLFTAFTACVTTESKSWTEYGWDADHLYNGATVTKQGDMDVLDLGATDGYYDLDAEVGGAFVASVKDFTVSVYFKVDSLNTLEGYGHFLFAFSKLAENKADKGPYMAMRLNEQRFETSTGGWEHEEIVMQGDQPARNVWIHALFRQAGHSGELYLDGQLIGRNDNMPILSEIFPEAPACCWIGRAPFNGDKYLTHTQVAGFRLYDYAVSDEELHELVAKRMSFTK